MSKAISSILLWIFSFGIVESLREGLKVNFTKPLNFSSIRIYLFEGESLKINFSIRLTFSNESFLDKPLYINCWMTNLKVCVLSNWSDVPLSGLLLQTFEMEIKDKVKALRLGGSRLRCSLNMKDGRNGTEVLFEDEVAFLIVKRIPTVSETVFRFVVMFFVIFLTFAMGCGLERDVILGYIKKPVSPAIGFLCQFLFMPLISAGLAKLTNLNLAFGFGLLTIGCSPGGGASNIWTVLFGGDLNLSMTMTFISSCAALFMMPFWLFVLGRFFIDPSVVKIPYDAIGLNLLQVVIPAGFGMLFRWKWERHAINLAKRVKIMGFLLILFIMTFGTYANLYIYKLMGEYPYLLPIGASLPWLGFVFGFIMSVVTRRSKTQAVAIALETGFQNIGIALLILKFSMPQPQGDLGAVMPIIVAIFTPMPLYFGLLGLTIKRKFFEKKSEALELTSVIEVQKNIRLEENGVAPEDRPCVKSLSPAPMESDSPGPKGVGL